MGIVKTRLKVIVIGIILASVSFGTYQSVMYTCGTMPVFMETPREPTLWKCLDIWKHQSKQPQPQRILPDPICFVVKSIPSDEISSGKTIDTCLTLDQFEDMGCTKPMLEHILRYSNLLDYEVDGHVYLDWAGLPDGISNEKFQECFDTVSEKRILIEPEEFSFCGADGFDSKGNPNTDNSTHHWDGNECTWMKIVSFDDPVYSIPFGLTQEQLDGYPVVDPIYVKNPNNPEELILDIDSMQLIQKILKDCGPPKYKGFAYGLEYSNGTHVIDNNTCEWRKIK